MYVCMDVCMYVGRYVCMDGWMDVCMYGWMDGWMDVCIMYVCGGTFILALRFLCLVCGIRPIRCTYFTHVQTCDNVVFKVLRNGRLRFILYTCPNL